MRRLSPDLSMKISAVLAVFAVLAFQPAAGQRVPELPCADKGRPLVFYALDASATLKLTKRPDGRLRIYF